LLVLAVSAPLAIVNVATHDYLFATMFAVLAVVNAGILAGDIVPKEPRT
jgi:translation initiation factor 2 gamma subunit (eIF-2gamma)